MIRFTTAIFTALILSGCGVEVSAAAPADATQGLKIQVKGIRGTEGNVVVAIYDNKQAFDQHGAPLAWVSVPAQSQTITLAEFPAQEIAIAAFHDTNRNGEYDVQDDVPLEGWGNSGNISQWSEPTFEAALIDVNNPSVVPVHMHYYR